MYPSSALLLARMHTHTHTHTMRKMGASHLWVCFTDVTCCLDRRERTMQGWGQEKVKRKSGPDTTVSTHVCVCNRTLVVSAWWHIYPNPPHSIAYCQAEETQFSALHMWPPLTQACSIPATESTEWPSWDGKEISDISLTLHESFDLHVPQSIWLEIR